MSSDVAMDQGIAIPDGVQSEALSIKVMAEKGRLSLRAKPADRTRIGKALGLTLPAKIGATSTRNTILSTCLGPDEWLLISRKPQHDKIYEKAISLSSEFIMSATEISHRNVGLVLSGAQAAETVNVGCALDLRLPSFPVGKCTRTLFEAAPILLYRADETEFHIEFWRSFAPYVTGLITAHIKGMAGQG